MNEQNFLPLPDYPVIDMHAHTGYAFDGSNVSTETQLQVMDSLGIRCMAASSLHALYYDYRAGNEALAAEIAGHPGRIYGYVALNPHHMDSWQEYCESMLARPGFIGIKLHPDFNAYPPDGPRYHEIYRYANERSLLVLNHSFGDAETIVDLALAYPNMKMICGHRCAYANPEEVAFLARNLSKRKNIYFDTTSSCLANGSLELYCSLAGSEHVIFGTDTPYFDPAFQTGRFLRCRLTETQRRQILRENALSLLYG